MPIIASVTRKTPIVFFAFLTRIYGGGRANIHGRIKKSGEKA